MRRIAIVVLALLMVSAPACAAMPTTVPIATELNLKSLPAGQQAVLAVVVDVPDGLHSQSNQPTSPNYIPFKVTIDANPAVELSPPVYPPGKLETYDQLGVLSVYTGRVTTYVPLGVKDDAKPGPLTLTGQVQYQMCNDRACFPPKRPKITIEATIAPAATKLEPNHPELFSGFNFSQFAKLMKPATAAEKPAAPKISLFGVELAQGHYVFPFVAALLIGMIFNIMPCVLPVVPLKIMSFYQTAQHNRARSVALAIVFSAGITAVFAILGLLVVVLRWLDWGKLFGNVYFLLGIIVLLLLFALWQFGVLKFVLPPGIYDHMPQGETYLGNFLFGIFTAILSTPCTFGLFFGLLIWASAQPGVIGFSLLTAVGIGMALPYIVLSGFPEVARRFPRTGPWAELVKQMMAFLLLASAVFFARRFIVAVGGDDIFWWTLFAVVAAAGIFLIARTIQFSPKVVPRVVAAALALLLVAPALAFTIRQTHPPIKWRPYDPDVVEQARKDGKTVVLEFTAAWCSNCIAVETSVFHDARTVEAFDKHNVVPVRVDLTRDDAPGWKILSELSGVGAIPLTAVYAPNLKEPIQLAGIYSTSDLVAALDRAR